MELWPFSWEEMGDKNERDFFLGRRKQVWFLKISAGISPVISVQMELWPFSWEEMGDKNEWDFFLGRRKQVRFLKISAGISPMISVQIELFVWYAFELMKVPVDRDIGQRDKWGERCGITTFLPLTSHTSHKTLWKYLCYNLPSMGLFFENIHKCRVVPR